jgi:hypothetical protein
MNFTAKFAKSTSATMAIKIHAAGCGCVGGNNNAKTGYQWGLESTTLPAALAEVKASEDADERGIKVTAAPCAKV